MRRAFSAFGSRRGAIPQRHHRRRRRGNRRRRDSSAVRAAILGPESPRFSGHVVYRGLVPAARVAHLGIEVAASVWWGPDHHFVQYFVGADARYLNWVAVTPGEWRLESWTAKGEVADALKEFAGWHPQVRALIGSVDTTNRWALYDRDRLPRWSVGRVTLMGDAAHPMLPYMAQGAVQSIEDAAVLAKCLEHGDAHDVENGAAALRGNAQASRIQMSGRLAPQRRHVPSGRRRGATTSRREPGVGSGRPATSERMALWP